MTALYVMLESIQESDDCPIEDLETAFSRNTSLENVFIRDLDEEFIVVQILRGLAAHCRFREL